jgi:DNA-binding transcriptional regulator YdaS (Cro superfamily)
VIVSNEEARARLKEAVERAGGQKAFAKKVGISAPLICTALSGRSRVSTRLSKHLGIEVVSQRVATVRCRGTSIPDHLADLYDQYREYAPEGERVRHTLDLVISDVRRRAA